MGRIEKNDKVLTDDDDSDMSDFDDSSESYVKSDSLDNEEHRIVGKKKFRTYNDEGFSFFLIKNNLFLR